MAPHRLRLALLVGLGLTLPRCTCGDFERAYDEACAVIPCDGGSDADDAGPGLDAAVLDASVSDGGLLDAGGPDASTADAGTSDSGSGLNDAGVNDAGVSDAGSADAGAVDAGGVLDSGQPGDAGTGADAGVEDAGSDAGVFCGGGGGPCTHNSDCCASQCCAELSPGHDGCWDMTGPYLCIE